MSIPAIFADLSTTPASNSVLVSDADSVNVIDNHFRASYAMLASIYQNTGNGWTSPYLPKAGGTLTGNTTLSSGILWVGNSSTNNSDDPQIVISRNVDGGGSGNGHAYTDSSTINRTGAVSYNSYDCRVTFSGSYSYGHYAAFQSGPTFSTAGTITDHFAFYSYPTITAGTLTNYYGLYVQPPAISGSGAVTNAYGIYFGTTFGKSYSGVGTLNYAFYNASDAPFYSAGAVHADRGLSAGNGAGAAYTPVKTVDAVTSSGTLAGLRLQQVGVQILDVEIPASQTYAKMSNAAGQILKINADRSIVYTMPTTMPTLANGEGAFAQISDTNLQYSYRGSDGVLRSTTWPLT